MRIKYIILFFIILFSCCNLEYIYKENIYPQNLDNLILDEMPDFGLKGKLKGKIIKTRFPNHRIAIYIYKNGWFNKPYWYPSTTDINPDGSFECDITTDSGDEYATKIAIFVIAKDYKPPLLDGEKELPEKIFKASYYYKIFQRGVLDFSGYKWIISSSKIPIGPGPNYFSSHPSDIFIDEKGRLHLKIVKRNEKWFCSAVILSQNLGYGTYIFYLSSRFDLFDKNTVVGLFTWDNNAPEFNYREIDIEFSKWGNDNFSNSQFVMQPSIYPKNIFRFNIFLDNDKTTHFFKWTAKSILFQSLYGHKIKPENNKDIIAKWVYKGKDVPPTGGERAMINFWLVDGKPPSDEKEYEVIIEKFEFIPE